MTMPLPVVAETEAVGLVPAAKPKTLNLADEVDCPPKRKSTVELLGTITPPAICSKGEVLLPVLSVLQVTKPVESVFRVQVE